MATYRYKWDDPSQWFADDDCSWTEDDLADPDVTAPLVADLWDAAREEIEVPTADPPNTTTHTVYIVFSRNGPLRLCKREPRDLRRSEVAVAVDVRIDNAAFEPNTIIRAESTVSVDAPPRPQATARNHRMLDL